MPPWGTTAQIVVSVAVVAAMIWACLPRRRTPQPKPPDIEQRFRIRDVGPWPSNSPIRVVVVDVKEGWVKSFFYAREPTPQFEKRYGEQRDTVVAFFSMFEPIDPGEI